MKPPDAGCTSQWGKGRVSGVTCQNNISVDGMARHVLDVRRVITSPDDQTEDVGQEREDEQQRDKAIVGAL